MARATDPIRFTASPARPRVRLTDADRALTAAEADALEVRRRAAERDAASKAKVKAARARLDALEGRLLDAGPARCGEFRAFVHVAPTTARALIRLLALWLARRPRPLHPYLDDVHAVAGLTVRRRRFPARRDVEPLAAHDPPAPVTATLRADGDRLLDWISAMTAYHERHRTRRKRHAAHIQRDHEHERETAELDDLIEAERRRHAPMPPDRLEPLLERIARWSLAGRDPRIARGQRILERPGPARARRPDRGRD